MKIFLYSFILLSVFDGKAQALTKDLYCREAAVRIADDLGATFERETGPYSGLLFSHKLSSDLNLTCDVANLFGVSIYWPNNQPVKEWFALGAEAGQIVTGVSAQSLLKAARKCLAAAIRSSGESEVVVGKALVQCTSHYGPSSLQIWTK